MVGYRLAQSRYLVVVMIVMLTVLMMAIVIVVAATMSVIVMPVVVSLIVDVMTPMMTVVMVRSTLYRVNHIMHAMMMITRLGSRGPGNGNNQRRTGRAQKTL